MIRAIILTCGYVEDQKTSFMAFMHPKGFETEEEALVSLANDLKGKYILDNGDPEDPDRSSLKECCKKGMLEKDNFCKSCGGILYNSDLSFDVESFTDWIYEDLHGSTCDSYGTSHMWTNQLEWSPWEITEIFNLKRSQILLVNENAERLLGIALSATLPNVRKALKKGIFSLGYC